MGLFGGGGRRERDELELRDELVRLDGLSLDELAAEGVQRLEQRGLVVVRISGRDQTDVDLRLTRAGRRALERGDLGDDPA